MTLLLALTLLMPTIQRDPDPLIRETTTGSIRGLRSADGRTMAWLGVPYAAPPVGELRWRSPTPHPRWDTLRSTTELGAACPQVGGIHGPGLGRVRSGAEVADGFGRVVGDEDCLTLNVWRPATTATALPVVVFFHGGANVAGYAGDPLYDGTDLALRWNAVVVSVNYRLGVLDWFSHPALRATRDPESGSGNLGLLDLAAALRFVQANAAAFGGDAGSVTVVGQSAGAVNTFALLASPLSKGLFHRAILMSGALVAQPLAARDGYALAVLHRLFVADGLAPDSAAAAQLERRTGATWLRAYLESRSVEQLVAASSAVQGGGLPTADGVVLPLDLPGAISAVVGARVPLILGGTAHEGKYFLKGVYLTPDAERWRLAHGGAASAPSLASLLKPHMATSEQFHQAAAQAGEPVHALLDGTRDLFAGTGTPVYVYRFDWARGGEPWKTLLGGTHGIDLPFLFGTFGPGYYGPLFDRQNEPGRVALREALLGSLGGFVRRGEPDLPPGVSEWPRWTAASPSLIRFDASDEFANVVLQRVSPPTRP